MSDLSTRMADIERRYQEARRVDQTKQSQKQKMLACWSCRYREYEWAPTSALCDCENPLARHRRTLQEKMDGNCGAESLLYRRPGFNPAKWIWWLVGRRP